jgi:hypothetical protein
MTYLLEPEHVVGRNPACSLHLEERYVSGQHAALRWGGERWELRDLGSRNGTFLDGTRLKPCHEYPLRRGSRIAFGKADREWELTDDAAPAVMAVPLDGKSPLLLDGDLLAVPSNDEPLATIYSLEGRWVLERPDESNTPIANRQIFEVAGCTYRFCCADGIPKTAFTSPSHVLALEVQHLQLTFSVSKDEEYVHLQISCGGAIFDLGTRGHNYLLLTLARQRLEDATEGLPESTCGWIYQEDLSHDPSMVPPQLNIDVFRIRKQFAAIGVLDPANIIERRPRTRQLRVGSGRIAIVRV